jgi:hypothetical protein
MKVYIVMIAIPSTWTYSGVDWEVHKVFALMSSAEEYIKNQTKEYDYDILEEDVL